jgi:hypothetical protein
MLFPFRRKAVSDSIECGELKAALPVLIIYRRSADPRFLGDPLRVEFTDKKWQFIGSWGQALVSSALRA